MYPICCMASKDTLGDELKEVDGEDDDGNSGNGEEEDSDEEDGNSETKDGNEPLSYGGRDFASRAEFDALDDDARRALDSNERGIDDIYSHFDCSWEEAVDMFKNGIPEPRWVFVEVEVD